MTTYGKGRVRQTLSITILGVGLVLLSFGCSTGPQDPGLSLVDAQGNHAAAFLTIHPVYAVSDVDQCMPCHGSDLTGGIAKTSCLTAACHHDTLPTWANFSSHGAAAKRAPGNSGFRSCRICHAADFSGGGAGIACSSCHRVPAPHPAAPWRASTGPTHTDTDIANAPVCAECHFPGSPNNPSGHPATPAPAGTTPGCFNSTLCHGQSAAPHALGAAWRDPAVGGANFHGLTAKQNLAFCQTCHGTPGTVLFDGGSAPTACSACHPAADAHPTTWFDAPQTGFPPYTPSHRNSGSTTTACAICHKVNGPGTGPNPGAPSCFSASFTNADSVFASCHSGGPGAANHAVPYLDPDHLGVDQAGFDSNCSNCHAVSGSSPVSSAPACQVCHTAGSPLSPTGSFGDCSSCHGYPPDGGLTAYPNVAGAHVVHLGLDGTGTPVDCDTCHNLLGFVTQAHYDRANGRPGAGGRVPPGDLAFNSTYNAQSGASSFDNTALTCTNVSCHGGQTTPNWQTGTINVNTQCTACHAFGTTQYNGFSSGQHNRHVNNLGYSCTVCHNTTTLAPNHFTDLATHAMEGPASATIGGGSTNIPSGSYNPSTRSCNPSCHGSETW
jgi:predicted CxxxxCH...CXXCH cytochrome family protein